MILVLKGQTERLDDRQVLIDRQLKVSHAVEVITLFDSPFVSSLFKFHLKGLDFINEIQSYFFNFFLVHFELNE